MYSKTLTQSNISNVAASATAVDLIAANELRHGLMILNASPATLYLAVGATANATNSYTISLAANSWYEMPIGYYTDRVSGIWANGTISGNAVVTEVARFTL